MNRRFKGIWIPKEIWESKDLSITDRCLLAEIDSLCDSPKGCYASNSYFAKFFGVSERTISRSVRNLQEMNLIEVRINKSKTGSERFITTRQFVNDPLANLSKTHSPNCLPINTIKINTSSIDIEEKNELFPESNPNKKTLFSNSVFASKNVFLKNFSGADFENVDVYYYYHAVSDWSDQSNTKRTAKGWLATARTFMRNDAQNDKLKMLKQAENNNYDEMLEFMEKI